MRRENLIAPRSGYGVGRCVICCRYPAQRQPIPSVTCSWKSFVSTAWVLGLRDCPLLNASTTERLSASMTSCALRSCSGCLRQHSVSTSSSANITLLFMCRGSHSCGNPPLAENFLHGTATTPPHWFDDASGAATVACDSKWRASYHGPFWDVDDRLSHVRSSSRRFGLLLSCIARPFVFAIAANMTCVHRDAGWMATDMLTHFPTSVGR